MDLVLGRFADAHLVALTDAELNELERWLDVPVALLCMLLTAPLWLLCILGIALTMPGPLFFRHQRRGLFGRPFGLYKFRSMVKDAQLIKVEDMSGFDDKYKLKNDPRITRVGRLLRKSSLDELPQLWNVLTGEMSLVGPRPMLPEQTDLYPERAYARAYCQLRPGLTGFWQVWGRNDTAFDARATHDSLYFRRLSFVTDLFVLLLTVAVVLRGTGH